MHKCKCKCKAIPSEGPWSHLPVLLIVLVQNKMLQDVRGAFNAPEELRMLVTECNREQQKEKDVQGCSKFLR